MFAHSGDVKVTDELANVAMSITETPFLPSTYNNVWQRMNAQEMLFNTMIIGS